MLPILPHDEHQRTLEEGRKINDRIRREFFQAIADARPQRIKMQCAHFLVKNWKEKLKKWKDMDVMVKPKNIKKL